MWLWSGSENVWTLKISDVNLSPLQLSMQGRFPAWKAALEEPLVSCSFLPNYTEIVSSTYNKKLDFARLKWRSYLKLSAICDWKLEEAGLPGELCSRSTNFAEPFKEIKRLHLLCFSHIKAGFYHNISLPLFYYSRSHLQYCLLGWVTDIQQF